MSLQSSRHVPKALRFAVFAGVVIAAPLFALEPLGWGSNGGHYAVLGTTAYFNATDHIHGKELWKDAQYDEQWYSTAGCERCKRTDAAQVAAPPETTVTYDIVVPDDDTPTARRRRTRH